LTAEIDIAETIAEYSSETVAAAQPLVICFGAQIEWFDRFRESFVFL
jgi:hypothetical protein